MTAMEDEARLHGLVDEAFGSPELGVVNFKALKTLLLGILSSTKISEFSPEKGIRPVADKKEEGFYSEDSLNDAEGEEEQRQEAASRHEDGELKSDGEKKTGDDFSRFPVKMAVGGGKFDAEFKELREEVKRLNKTQDELQKRLENVEQENGANMLFMPSGQRLLSFAKTDSDNNNQSQNRRGNFETRDNAGSMEDYPKHGTKQDSKVINNTWQTVKINKRLQTIEDGMDKVFAMLDIISNEQKQLQKSVSLHKAPEIIETRNYKDDSKEKINFDQDFDKVNDLDERLKELENFTSLQSSDNKLKEDLAELLSKFSDLDENFKGLERTVDWTTKAVNQIRDDDAKISDSVPTFQIPDQKDFTEDLQRLRDGLKIDIDGVKNILKGLVMREEMEEFVKWPALEEALKVKGLAGDIAEDVENESGGSKADVNLLENDRPKKDKEHTRDSGTTLTKSKSSEDSFIKSKHPSEEMKECLQRISEMVVKYDELEDKVDRITTQQEKSKEDAQKEDEMLRSSLQDMKTQLDSTTQTSENNKSSIESVREDIDALAQDQQLGPGSADFDEYIAGLIKGHMLDLEDQGNVTSDALNHLSNTMQNELRAKQLLIDALYECVERLQRNKADVTDASSIFDLEAYKNALDTKVNMSEFDETMATLDQNLRDVLDKVEQYSNEEEGLKNALMKLSQDMKDKLDAKAGEALKKYLESRIAKLQISRENLVSKAEQDISNAAGTRRPLGSIFHCISCDRPVNLPGQLPVTQRLPKKKNRGPYKFYSSVPKDTSNDTSFNGGQEDEKINDKQLELWNENLVAAVNRPCGGSHTILPYAVKKPARNGAWAQINTILDNPRPSRFAKRGGYRKEKSVVDLLLGTDGHVYRGRYRMNEIRYSKKVPPVFDRRALRSRSAEQPRPTVHNTTQHHECAASHPNSLRNSPRSLPPLLHGSSLNNTPEATMVANRNEISEKRDEKSNRKISSG